ncbi:hypothetical protein P7C73_g3973, partial [Tremellales sp. Uapishka_1]
MSRPTSTTPLLPHSRSPSPRPDYTRSQSVQPLRRRRRSTPPIHVFPAALAFCLFMVVAFVAWDVSSLGNCYVKPLCDLLGDGMEKKEDIWWRNAGPYAPWRSLGPAGGRKGLPRGCEIDQVTILHRHAARYPTKASSIPMQDALDKLANRTVRLPRRHPELAFLAKADLQMTGWEFDGLMNSGRKESWRSGRQNAAMYKKLIDEGNGVFARSAGGGRVVETAGYWLQGYLGESFKLKSPDQLHQTNLTMPEGTESNNTLSVKNCPAYEALSPPEGTEALSTLLTLLTHTRDRLNAILDPNPPLDIPDVIQLGEMCAFDSQTSEEWEGWSRWCSMFSGGEWETFGYIKEVQRWFECGAGSTYGSTMGAGWVNELVARLTDSRPVDRTTTNRTLDGDEITFPRGGKRVFVDFTHDNEMVEILTALGIMKQHRSLPTSYVPELRTFVLSEIIPFGSQFIFERIACDLGDWEPDPNDSDQDRSKDGKKDYVRILINDKITPVNHVACKQSGFVEHGMCEVESFVESQAASNEADWGDCMIRK